MLRVGRDLCGSFSPTPCPGRVIYSKLYRTLSRRVLNISREGDSTASLGSLFQGSINLYNRTVSKSFSKHVVTVSRGQETEGQQLKAEEYVFTNVNLDRYNMILSYSSFLSCNKFPYS